MFCLAGIGGYISGLVHSAKDAPQTVVIDGCDIGCSKAILENADVPFRFPLTGDYQEAVFATISMILISVERTSADDQVF